MPRAELSPELAAVGLAWERAPGFLLGSCEPLVPFGLDEARAYVAEARWVFAKTMPRDPHWYTIRGWRHSLEQRFEAMARLIRTDGVLREWPRNARSPRWVQRYLVVDDWMYWVMADNTVAGTVGINRAAPDLDD